MASPTPQTVGSLDRAKRSGESNRRADIQGLRAVAVVLVIAFHAGLPVRAGFIGVDVFFVISGFVITAMLHREWQAHGRIRFGRFYLRRFKRLTPALAVTVAVTLILSALFLPPLEVQETAAATGIGAMLLVANFVISLTTGNYFDAPAETNPLLNTWSLSVEEQFYLIFPLLLAAGWIWGKKLRRRKAGPLILAGIVTLASFLLAVYGSSGADDSAGILAGFYSPFSRAWEFALGGILALSVPLVRRLLTSRAALAVGFLGGLLLLFSLLLIDRSTPFPGFWTLLPVGATLLLLAAGSGQPNLISRALSLSPVTKVGDWSYSLYLWHWPLIVIAVFVWPEWRYAALIAAAFSVLPALLSYYVVEQPIRKLPVRRIRQWATLIGITVLTPILLGLALIWAQQAVWAPKLVDGGEWNHYQGDVGHIDYHRYVDEHFYPCSPADIREHAPQYEAFNRCQQSKPDSDVTVALLGDSHAEHLFIGLAEELPKQNVAFYITADLPSGTDPDSLRILNHVVDSPTIELVIVNSYWAVNGVKPARLKEVLTRLTDNGKTVVVTDDVPNFPFDAAECKYIKAPALPYSACSQDGGPFLQKYETYRQRLEDVVSEVPGAILVHTVPYFCDESTCEMTENGYIYYRDNDHLNIPGSQFLAKRLLEDNPQILGSIE